MCFINRVFSPVQSNEPCAWVLLSQNLQQASTWGVDPALKSKFIFTMGRHFSSLVILRPSMPRSHSNKTPLPPSPPRLWGYSEHWFGEERVEKEIINPFLFVLFQRIFIFGVRETYVEMVYGGGGGGVRSLLLLVRAAAQIQRRVGKLLWPPGRLFERSGVI